MMINKQLQNELNKALKENKIKVRYPKGYQRWRKKFYSTLRDTKGNVSEALDKIHGKSSKNT